MKEAQLKQKLRYGLRGNVEVLVILNSEIEELKKGSKQLKKAVENVKKALKEVRKECQSLSEQKKPKATVAKP